MVYIRGHFDGSFIDGDAGYGWTVYGARSADCDWELLAWRASPCLAENSLISELRAFHSLTRAILAIGKHHYIDDFDA